MQIDMDEALKVLEARGDPTQNLHYRTRFALRLATLLGEPATELIAELSRMYTWYLHSPKFDFTSAFYNYVNSWADNSVDFFSDWVNFHVSKRAYYLG